MKTFQLKEKICYPFFYSLFLSGMLLAGAGSFLGIRHISWQHILVLSAVVLMCSGIRMLTLPKQFTGVAVILVLIVGFGLINGLRESAAFVQGYVWWLFGQSGWQPKGESGYELMQVVWVAVAGCFMADAAERFYGFKVCLAGFLILVLMYCLFREVSLSRIGVVWFLCYLVMVYAEGIQRFYKKDDFSKNRSYILWLMPFILLYITILWFVPISDQPYQWKWVKNAYQQIREFAQTISHKWDLDREDFDLSQVGFSSKAAISGVLTENREKVMEIQGGKKFLSNIYLAGGVFDTFDGKKWESRQETDSPNYVYDTLETQYAVEQAGLSPVNDYLSFCYFTLRYEELTTSHTFFPLKTKWLKAAESGKDLFTQKKSYGLEYEVGFYQMDTTSEAFYGLLEHPQNREETEWTELLRDYTAELSDKVTLSDMEAYDKWVKKNYWNDVVLSEEVCSYLEEITKGADSKLARLRKIEEELSSYAYTKTPGTLPEDITDEKSFLDYFLLEKKQGYCTHFATAFTLLARAEGFPARYVQGFLVPIEGQQDITVYSDMAHAWPEVFIDGVGWIPFEPTPGYSEMRNVSGKESAGENMRSNDLEERYANIVEEQPLEQAEKTHEENENDARWNRILLWSYRVLFFLLFTGILAVSVMILDKLIWKYRYEKQDWLGKYQLEWKQTMKVLSKMSLERADTETLQEFYGRVMEYLVQTGFTKEECESWIHFIPDYECILYGNHQADEVMVGKIRWGRERLLSCIRTEQDSKFGVESLHF